MERGFTPVLRAAHWRGRRHHGRKQLIPTTDPTASPLTSFFLAGFECGSQVRRDGQRVDVITGTAHDRWAQADYAQAAAAGLRTVRDGIRWHRIERRAGAHDFSSVLPMLRATEATGVQVLWDLFHYGWLDGLDFFSPAFVDRFGGLARAFARLVVDETGRAPLVVPVNEPSFVAWAAGVEGFLNPFALGRAPAIKAQLVRAAIAGSEGVWAVAPAARIVHTDPLINVIADPAKPEARDAARADHLAQYESWDMLAGRRQPELGGQPHYLDILGLNHFPWNQWIYHGPEIKRRHPLYRPLRRLLAEVHARYGRPLLFTEVGTEGDGRAPWLQYVGREARAALRAGVPCWASASIPSLTIRAGRTTAIARPASGATPTRRGPTRLRAAGPRVAAPATVVRPQF